MADPTQLNLELTLKQPAELFHAPELDPLNGVFDERSAVERILDALRENPSARAVSVVIHLPSEYLTDTLLPQVRAALVGYCGAQTQQMTRAQAPVRRLGIRSVLFGLIFVGGSLLLSAIFSEMASPPEFLSHFLVEGFLIAGWVALWYATEVWLFEIWEKRSERQYYERLQNMNIQFEPLETQKDKTR